MPVVLKKKLNSTMTELFHEIKDDPEWTPSENIDYTGVNVDTLKKLTDNWFDKLNYQGDFFEDYNEVLLRIDLLRQLLLKK